jgi:hypothetical protein
VFSRPHLLFSHHLELDLASVPHKSRTRCDPLQGPVLCCPSSYRTCSWRSRVRQKSRFQTRFVLTRLLDGAQCSCRKFHSPVAWRASSGCVHNFTCTPPTTPGIKPAREVDPYVVHHPQCVTRRMDTYCNVFTTHAPDASIRIYRIARFCCFHGHQQLCSLSRHVC